MFIPYPTDGLVDIKDVDLLVVENILKELNIEQVKHFKSVEELFAF